MGVRKVPLLFPRRIWKYGYIINIVERTTKSDLLSLFKSVATNSSGGKWLPMISTVIDWNTNWQIDSSKNQIYVVHIKINESDTFLL